MDPFEKNQNLYRNLCEFQVTARYLNFSKAAKDLFISRSAVSRHMTELEQFMGVELFEHNSNSLEITHAGKYLLDRSHNLIEKIEGLKDELNTLDNNAELKLDLFGAACYYPRFFNSVSHFCDNNHNIQFRTGSASLRELLIMLERNEIDAIMTFDFTTWGMSMRGYKKQILCHSYFSLLMGATHPLTAFEKVTKKDLAQYEILSSVPIEQMSNNLFTVQIEQPSTLNKPKPLEFDNPTPINSILLSINTSKSVAILPDPVSRYVSQGCAIRNLVDLDMPFDIILLYKNSNRNPALKMFLEEEIKMSYPGPLE